MASPKPVMLIILDGLGIREMEHGNAVKQANAPHIDSWMTSLERSILDASGEAVGLVADQMGNSEVGHLNLGAGRIVFQDISAIDHSIKTGALAANQTLSGAMEQAKQGGHKVHLIGLLGTGGVHSHQRHLNALLGMIAANGVQTAVHVITDGRDTPPNSAINFLHDLEHTLAAYPSAAIATVSGRYYAMDRDNRWERTRKAYDALVLRQGERAVSAQAAIEQAYAQDITDEFILPTVIGDDDDLKIVPGDCLIFYNFRADRMRQIVRAFCYQDQAGLDESEFIQGLDIITFTVYEDDFPVKVLFGKETLQNTLGEWLSKHGKKQYHSAETEKYPHVTFFFNGRREDPYPGEDRRIIPSPKVATYDLQPEMSAYELTEATLERLRTHDDDFILINYANPDMVGHTGSLEAAIKAVETVDACAHQLVEAVLAKGGVVLVTADHGNCERMVEEATGEAHTYHTTNPVSLFVIGHGYFRLFPRGILADVAPTVLDLLGLPKPDEMTGRSLVDVAVWE